ncbi:MAG: type II/IV secretion system protein [Candidatus Doudnabacteria bacterium]|nr:type II/IV secretion system protein [Candidatus Doudnabacteria bacterium]
MTKNTFLTSSEEQELASVIAGVADKEQVKKLTNKLLTFAVLHGASDIHLECTRSTSIVRFRVDGVLYDVMDLSHDLHDSTVARIKVLADLKTDERRVPQDGRFSGELEGVIVDFRVSVMPLIFGEKAAIRLLRQERKEQSLLELGFSPSGKSQVEASLKKPNGMILVCGPTGSGKTTTLYTLMRQLLAERGNAANLFTIEDPVEYSVERTNQIQANPGVGLTFSTALRGLLRQDADIIMVGEIRDKESALAATQASLTGRLLLSSLHTRNAVGALIRLLDIGIEPYLVASAVSLIIAQRLVRLVCKECKGAHQVDEATFAELDRKHHLTKALAQYATELGAGGEKVNPLVYYRGKGCSACHFTGYQGRTGIFEVLEMTEAMRSLVQQRSSFSQLTEQAHKEGMATLMQHGFVKALAGLTTPEEVLRVSLD